VLIVAAHPDDAEFMAGSIMSHWQSQGASLHYVLVTDGIAGSRDVTQTPQRLAEIRRDEQREASRALGSEDVTFLGYPDGRVEASLELRWDIARAIRRVRPDVVIAQDPYFRYSENYINHPDHRAVADATLSAIMPVANTLLAALDLLEEGLQPHDVKEVYLTGPVNPNLWVPIAEEDILRQVKALQAHVSQLGDWPVEEMTKRMKEGAAKTAEEAREHGVECDYATRFFYIHMREYEEEEQIEPQTEERAEAQV
jgi:LmbE family N-acetylglucosaminyl deacetylase